MNSYWVEHAVSEKDCETTKSLKICYLYNIGQALVYHTKISNIDELKAESRPNRNRIANIGP